MEKKETKTKKQDVVADSQVALVSSAFLEEGAQLVAFVRLVTGSLYFTERQREAVFKIGHSG